MSTEQNMNTTQETGMVQKAGTAQVHTIAPVYDENSRILILGSFPSVKSREQGFFTGTRETGSGRCWQGSQRLRFLLLWKKRRISFWNTGSPCGM